MSNLCVVRSLSPNHRRTGSDGCKSGMLLLLLLLLLRLLLLLLMLMLL
jgi:hypothetical protein